MLTGVKVCQSVKKKKEGGGMAKWKWTEMEGREGCLEERVIKEVHEEEERSVRVSEEAGEKCGGIKKQE